MKRIKWVDDVKTIACILVVLGHFFQSMVKSGIMCNDYAVQWFEYEIYLFHVNLFFICSGYIYQKKYVDSGIKDEKKNVILSKFYSLIIPMIVFASITWGFKYLAGENVNVANQSYIKSVLIEPIPPYWFLQTLFIIFVITPQIKTDVGYILLMSVSIFIRICSYYVGGIPQIIYNVMLYEMWFVMGMLINKIDIDKIVLKKSAILGYLMGAIFLIISTCLFSNSIFGYGTILGMLACGSIILLSIYYRRLQHKQIWLFDVIKRYMFPIYLMHTIFAAPIRIMLIKLGISNIIIQVVCGVIASFAGPIIYMKIATLPKMNWIKWLVYPRRK